MLAIVTLGNEHNVVAIDTYCDNLPLIATNIVVAIDRNPCSEIWNGTEKSAVSFPSRKPTDQ
jgi:hypothetical protein